MEITVFSLGFIAVLLVVYGFLRVMHQITLKSLEFKTNHNIFTSSPIGGFVVLLAKANTGKSLSEKAAAIEKKLLQSGMPGGKINGPEFLAVAELIALSAVLLILFAAALMGGIGFGSIGFALFIGAFVFMISFSVVDSMVATRTRQISRQFPYFLDLAVMTMEAGSGFLETVSIYTKDNPKDVLSEEFRIFLGESKMGKTLAEALDAMKTRIAADEIHNVINAIIQGQKLGTPLAQVLKAQSDALRFKRSQLAERYAEELKVRLQGPAMLMMISVLILILGPALLEATKGGVI